MRRPNHSATFTTEFGHEFELERTAWLRRRFLWYTGVVFVISFFLSGLAVGAKVFGLATESGKVISVGEIVAGLTTLVTLGAYGYAFYLVWRRTQTRWPLLKIVYWLIVITGGLTIVGGALFPIEHDDGSPQAGIVTVQTVERPTPSANPQENPAPGDGNPADAQVLGDLPPVLEAGEVSDIAPPAATRPPPPAGPGRRQPSGWAEMVLGTAMGGIGVIFFMHFPACLFLPWTPRESLKPIIPLVMLNAGVITGSLVVLLTMGRLGWAAVGLSVGLVGFSVAIALPGLFVCWWRHGRFRDRFTTQMLRGRYSEMKRELTDARRIHEALFPDRRSIGPLRLEYTYEPMRQIGGDYLHANWSNGPAGPNSVLSLVIVDVTGHGIPAALTVNRLHGELERLFAENPQTRPGEVLTALNRYVHLTLAAHSVYVTALCLRFDAGQEHMEYASGGHPPAFVRGVGGTVEQLDSTAFVLGACGSDDFQAEPRRIPFGLGDAFIGYTDGAIESRNASGRFLGVKGIQRVVALSQPEVAGGWPATLRRLVEQHRHGPATDDTLVVEVRRPIGPDRSSGPRTSPAASALRRGGA